MSKWWSRIKERFVDDEGMPGAQITQPNIEQLPAETVLPDLEQQKTNQPESDSAVSSAQQILQAPVMQPPQKSYLEQFMEHVAEHNKLVQEYRKQYVADIAALVKKHYRTLKTKYDQTVFHDDYGYAILDNFWPELSYFTVNVLLKEIPPFMCDSYIARDPTLWNSYEKLRKEHLLNLSIKLKKEANRKSGYAWHYATAFCFTLQMKGVGDISDSDLDISDAGLHVNVDFVASIIDDPIEEKEKVVNIQDVHEVLLYAYSRIEHIAFTIFDFTRILEESVETEILKVPGVEKTRNAPDNPLEYEKYVAQRLAGLGFNARTTKASGDQGADVLADKNGISFAIQCKKYSSPVGNKAVQEANAGRDFYKRDYAVVVSNADFTKAAKQAANACKVILLNDNQLEKLLSYTNKALSDQ